MNKTEFAQKLAKKADISQAKALEIVNLIFAADPGKGIIAVELDAGSKVTIPGFGTFGTKSRAALEDSYTKGKASEGGDAGSPLARAWKNRK